MSLIQLVTEHSLRINMPHSTLVTEMLLLAKKENVCNKAQHILFISIKDSENITLAAD